MIRLPQKRFSDEEESSTTALKTPIDKRTQNRSGHVRSFGVKGANDANCGRRNEREDDISPCLRPSLKSCVPQRGLCSKIKRKLRFPIRSECPKRRLRSGQSKRAVMFVCGIGLVTEADLLCRSWSIMFGLICIATVQMCALRPRCKWSLGPILSICAINCAWKGLRHVLARKAQSNCAFEIDHCIQKREASIRKKTWWYYHLQIVHFYSSHPHG